MMLGQMQLQATATDPQIQWQSGFEAVFEFDAKAQKVEIELPRLGLVKHPQDGNRPVKGNRWRSTLIRQPCAGSVPVFVAQLPGDQFKGNGVGDFLITRLQRGTQYGKNIRWLPPQLQEVKASNGKLILKLDTWAIPFHDGPIQGFAIAGKDGRFQPAKAEWLDKNAGKGQPDWERSTIVLSSDLVPEPVYFRYAWARNPLETLKSSDLSNLPFDTQRNDTFTLADTYQIYTGKKPSTPGVLHGGEMRELTQALKAEDMKRRVEEAKKLLNAK